MHIYIYIFDRSGSQRSRILLIYLIPLQNSIFFPSTMNEKCAFGKKWNLFSYFYIYVFILHQLEDISIELGEYTKI